MPISPYNDSMQFLQDLGAALNAELGPFKKPLSHVTLNPKIGTAVYACKPGKAKQLLGALKQLDFTTIERPIAYVYGGTRVEASGEKTFVNYNSAVGILIVGTDITKDSPL